MRNPMLALDVDLAIAARGRAALRDQIADLADGAGEDRLTLQLDTLAALLGDR